MPKRHLKKAVFLDRDGVINAHPPQRYVTTWEQFHFLPGVLKALQRLSRHPHRVIIVSNQSAVGRQIMSQARLKSITEKMLKVIRRRGGRIDAVYYCTHSPKNRCPCRKPGTALLQKAARRFSIDLRQSYVVGDDAIDIRMGRSSGCQTILVLSGRHSRASSKPLGIRPDRVAQDLAQAVEWILQHKKLGGAG